MRRVVISGVGAVTGLAHNVPVSWELMLKGASAVRNYVNDPVLRNGNKGINLALVRDFDYEKWRYANNRMNSFLACACDQAIKDSGISLQKQAQTTGVSLGVMSSNISKLTEHIEQCSKSSFDKINRLNMLHILCHIPTATLVTKYALKGPSNSLSTVCASGLSAIAQGFNWIKSNEAQTVIVGGIQDVYNSTSLFSSIKLQAMSTKHYDNPAQASRPFDKDKSGFVLGEGAGVLILQDYEKAIKRNAKIYAQILSQACTSDGYHLTRPTEDGQGGYRAMKKALDQAQITANLLDHVNCHATSTVVGDQAEAKAIWKLLQTEQNRNRVTITANKGHLGHGFGAAGAIQVIFGLLSMKNNICPLILNLSSDPVVKLNYAKVNTPQNINYMLKNAFGFGGVNVSMLFKKI